MRARADAAVGQKVTALHGPWPGPASSAALGARGAPVACLAVPHAPGGEATLPLLASASLDGSLAVWNLGRVVRGGGSGGGEQVLEGGAGAAPSSGEPSPGLGLPGAAAARCLFLSASAAALVSGGADGRVRLYDVAGGRLVSSLLCHSRAVRAVRLLQSGLGGGLGGDRELVASGGADGAVCVWDPRAPGAAAAVRLAGPRGHAAPVSCVVEVGGLLATAGHDHDVLCWDLREPHAPALRLQGPQGAVFALHVAAPAPAPPIGTDVESGPGCGPSSAAALPRLLAASKDGAVREWAVGGAGGTACRVFGAAAGAGPPLVAFAATEGGFFAATLANALYLWAL